MNIKIYNILLHILFITLLPYFFLKSITQGKYRRGLSERLGFINPSKLTGLDNSKTLWIHAVSVGETKAAVPLIRQIKKKYPDLKIAFSTVTATGQKVAEKEIGGIVDILFFYPLDLSCFINRTIEVIKPKAFILIEKEIWPGMLTSLNEQGVPVCIVNGTFSAKSFKRYNSLSFFFRDIFTSLTAFSASTKKDAEMATNLGVPEERVSVSGNLKFAMNAPIDDNQVQDLKFEFKVDCRPVIVAGSTHSGEEGLILETYKELKKNHPSLLLILAPRHPERFKEVETLIKTTSLSYQKRSNGELEPEKDIILLDTIGELTSVYALSTIAFIGGTLIDIGGHNLLEPALFSKPVIYGEHLSTCLYMATALEAAGASIRSNKTRLAGDMGKVLNDPALARKMGKAGRDVIDDNSGSLQRTLKIIESAVGL